MPTLADIVSEIKRSSQYIPYDVVGAPVDLATMVMRPFGYSVDKPVGGSEWLIEQAKQRGYADQPTGSPIETGTRFIGGMLSPGAAIGAAKAGKNMLREMTSMPSKSAITPSQSKLSILENPNFKDWFGKSKIVDEEGKPMVVYHGSGSKDITEFDPSKYQSVQKGDWGQGIYFTPSQWMANSYRQTAVKYSDPDVKKAYESLQNKAKEFGTTDMNSWLDLRAGKIDQSQYDELKSLDSKWRDALLKAEKSDKGKVYSTYLKMENPYVYTYGGITEPDLAARAKRAGHDGLIIKNDDGKIEEIVVFDSKQIKSAKENSGKFNPLSGNIYKGAAGIGLTNQFNKEE